MVSLLAKCTKSALNKGQLCCQQNFIYMKTNLSHTKPDLHSCKSWERTRKSTDCSQLSSKSWWGLVPAATTPWSAPQQLWGMSCGDQGCCHAGDTPAAHHRLWESGNSCFPCQLPAKMPHVMCGPTGAR